jgi:hypothetical protein
MLKKLGREGVGSEERVWRGAEPLTRNFYSFISRKNNAFGARFAQFYGPHVEDLLFVNFVCCLLTQECSIISHSRPHAWLRHLNQ